MMQTDVKSGTAGAGASTEVTTFRARIKALALTYTSAAGNISITDGNGGVTLFSFTPAAVAGSLYMLFPGEGILAETGIYVRGSSAWIAITTAT